MTTGIDQVTAERDGDGWLIRFRSVYAGSHHQLYANGQLLDVTPAPAERQFWVSEPAGPAELTIAAVSAADRFSDLSDQLPAGGNAEGWTFRKRVLRHPVHAAGTVVELLGDAATGEVSDVPLATAEVYPAWMNRWGFGQVGLGEGDFGVDGAGAPGLAGAFGGGPFGADCQALTLSAVLPQEGLHLLRLRTRSPDEQCVDSPEEIFISQPPPPPPRGLTVQSYSDGILRLKITPD
jgi:hypothetical protein